MTATKTKILDAAESLFAKRGIAGASLRAITDAAGVNLGSVYYYFASKERLVVEVLNRRMEEYNRKGMDLFAELKAAGVRLSVREAWRLMTASMLEFRRDHPLYMKFIQHMHLFREETLADFFMNKTQEFEDTLLEIVSERFEPEKRDEALLRSRLLLQMLHHIILDYSLVQMDLNHHRIFLDDDQLAEHIASIAASALGDFSAD